jgi:hypothetical protein
VAIITKDEVKEILQITGTTYDALIEILIPKAQGTFRIIRGIPWFEIEADITSSSATVNNISDDDLALVEESAYLEAVGIPESTLVEKVNAYASGRTNITENNIVMSVVATATTEDLLIRIFPPGSKYATAKIIDYMMDKDASTGYKSESIGNYSYDKVENKTGIPMDIAGLIQDYQSTHE